MLVATLAGCFDILVLYNNIFLSFYLVVNSVRRTAKLNVAQFTAFASMHATCSPTLFVMEAMETSKADQPLWWSSILHISSMRNVHYSQCLYKTVFLQNRWWAQLPAVFDFGWLDFSCERSYKTKWIVHIQVSLSIMHWHILLYRIQHEQVSWFPYEQKVCLSWPTHSCVDQLMPIQPQDLLLTI